MSPDPEHVPRIVQRGLYADELQVGAIYAHRPGRTVTEADNVLFSTMTMNPQALHLDAAWSESTEFGQRLVNSMFTLATVVGASVAQLTQGTLVANLGFSEITFPHPLHLGDTLYSETEVTAVRPSRSRPGQAVVSLVHTGRDQHGEVVVRAARATLMHQSQGPVS
ncbi:dehydratase [Brachybacterium sp. P6-10-X1]|uniref:MaoC family dehydratase n=1 Tax=Brachybacterium sp. P6-10-X1 TaxID=1903186 RepID=UPI000971BDF2|nr:MaoC family dehydratase [Brachybacterium sp. P6-10-X1]APX33575.1 dehydratase [Brachybacterium sp. P6-10-X1]